VLRHTKIIDVCIIVDNGNAKQSDEQLFFGDKEGNLPKIFWVPRETNMLDLLVQTGIFSSKGEAKRNGWKDKKDIPNGFSETTVGKLKHCLTILNVT
jgi:hypothetical protein